MYVFMYVFVIWSVSSVYEEKKWRKMIISGRTAYIVICTIQNFIVQLQPCSYKGRLLVYTGFFSPYVIFFPHFFRGNIFIFNIILLSISIGIKWPIQKHCVDWLRNPKFDQNLESIKVIIFVCSTCSTIYFLFFVFYMEIRHLKGK